MMTKMNDYHRDWDFFFLSCFRLVCLISIYFAVVEHSRAPGHGLFTFSGALTSVLFTTEYLWWYRWVFCLLYDVIFIATNIAYSRLHEMKMHTLISVL